MTLMNVQTDVTPTPCALRFSPARVVHYVAPSKPPATHLASASVRVLVSLKADGSVVSVSMDQASGDPTVDAAALASARSSVYESEVDTCRSLDSEYVLWLRYNVTSGFQAEQPPACSGPFQSATVANPVEPLYPSTLRAAGKRIVGIAVDIGPGGNVMALRVTRTSGIPELDAVAYDAARRSTYLPMLVGCMPHVSTYQYTIMLVPPSDSGAPTPSSFPTNSPGH